MGLAFPPTNRDDDIGVMAAGDLDAAVCQSIIDLHKNSKNFKVRGRVQREGGDVVEVMTRQTEVCVIHEDFDWVDNLIMDATLTANRTYNFNITGLIERPQLLKYAAPSKGYDWHLDIGSGDHSTRKISISMILNSDFDGGDLCFFGDGEGSITPDAGVIVCFPSFMPHKVAPVTRGTRWSLVCWVAGEPFR